MYGFQGVVVMTCNTAVEIYTTKMSLKSKYISNRFFQMMPAELNVCFDVVAPDLDEHSCMAPASLAPGSLLMLEEWQVKALYETLSRVLRETEIRDLESRGSFWCGSLMFLCRKMYLEGFCLEDIPPESQPICFRFSSCGPRKDSQPVTFTWFGL